MTGGKPEQREIAANGTKAIGSTRFLCYGPLPVRRASRGRARCFAAVAAGVISVVAPSFGGAASAPDAQALRDRATSLTQQEHRALLELYAAESSLQHAQAEAAQAQQRADRAAAAAADVRYRAGIARDSLVASQARVAEILELLYVEGGSDPLAVILGATSLDEMVTGIESLTVAASQNRRLAEKARGLRTRLERLGAELAQRRQALERTARDAAAAASSLERTVSARAAAVVSLREQANVTRARATALEAQAVAATETSARITAAPAEASAPAAEDESAADAPPPVSVVPAPGESRQFVADVVAYHLPGRTASGLPVGPGIVAVDPNVIPLGTRMFIPGYGPGVAADVGTAVKGNIIDLWFPSTAQALQWGRRTVTITIYG